MKYLYYPGCSLEGTALEYNLSTKALMKSLGAELVELPDWTCCGASAAGSISHLLSLTLSARNLALAESLEEIHDILVPCSACYLNLKKVEKKTAADPNLLGQINTVLAEADLKYSNTARVRHLLDVIANDFGAEKISSLVKNKLQGLTVAPYYGCQCLRPYPEFDNPEEPKSMEPVLTALGVDIHEWTMGNRCCGASVMSTNPDAALELTVAILKDAQGADAIVTVCPMCQMNLEAFQARASRVAGRDLTMNILYLPQLIGAALNLPAGDLRIDLNLAVGDDFMNTLPG